MKKPPLLLLLCLVVAAAANLSSAAPIPDNNDATTESSNLRRVHKPSYKYDDDDDDRRKRSGKSRGAKLDPLSPPVFIKQESSPIPIKKTSASELSLSCRADSHVRTKTAWFKDGERLTRDSTRQLGTFSFHRQTLTLDNVKQSDNGRYHCEVTNKYGSINRTYDVEVINRVAAMPPIIESGQPGNHTLVMGSPLTLECRTVIDDPAQPPVIQWFYHGKHPTTGTDRDENGHLYLLMLQECTGQGLCAVGVDGEEQFFVDDPEVYTIEESRPSDSGWYTCLIKNEIGSSHSSGYIEVLSEAPPDPEEAAFAQAKMGIGVVIVIAVVILCGVTCYCGRRVRKEKKQKEIAADTWNKVYAWTKVVLVEKQEAGLPLVTPKVTIEKKKAEHVGDPLLAHECEYEFQAADSKWELDRNKLHMSGTLGEGAFGRVLQAETYDPKLPKLVAVKMLKEGHTDQDMIDLVKEMEIMKVIGSHPNIINLLGVCTQPRGQPLYLVVEYAKNGNLKDFLRAQRPAPLTPTSPGGTPSPAATLYESPRHFNFDSPPAYPEAVGRSGSQESYCAPTLPLKDMLHMAWQVSRGMKFLASKRLVHRDLAARNVLITEKMELKIADFGMARDLQDSDYYRKYTSGRVPLKWMAPEAVFERKYTTKSDVWSFGVLFWEIVTLGDSPFKNVGSEVFTEQLRSGVTLPQPTNCPCNVYESMRACWRFEAEERPTWPWLVERLSRLHEDAQPNVYLELSHIPSPPATLGHMLR